MPVSLPKGANVSLSKEAPGLKDIVIGLGWDVRATTEGSGFDLDASLFMLKADDKVRNDADFVFYNNKTSPEGSVEHLGDDLTGEGAGDDEQQIKVDLESVPSEVTKLSVAVTIHEAEGRNQNFGMVNNAYIRVANGANGGEIARYDLSEEASTETAMIFGEVYRRGGEWKFRAVGQGFARGLDPLARNYGVDVLTEVSDPPPSEPTNPPEPARRELSVSELHKIITEALDRTGIQYGQREDRGDVYLLERDGVLLMVGALAVDGVPAAVSIFAFVLENVERTRELTADLLTRNDKMLPAWATHDQPDGTVRVTLSYRMSAEQLEVGAVERMVNSVLGTAVAEVGALQATYGGKRRVVVTEEPPIVPEGLLTFTGRYPGYEPARAMAAFLSVAGEPGRPRRPSYEERRDYWVFDGGGYVLAVGCFAEPDGTPVIVVTGSCEPEYSDLVGELMVGERSALQQSAHSTEFLGEAVHGITDAVASGTLRQLRPSEIGPIPDPVRGRPAPAEGPDPSLRTAGSQGKGVETVTQADQTNGPGGMEVEERVAIPEFVARVIPDCGEYFLWWLGVDGPALDEVAAHINALRGEDGWISLDEAGKFGFRQWENGPLTLLSWMTADDRITLSVWASHGLKGADKRAIRENVESVARGQGHAAAAAWAIASRPGDRLNSLEFLAGQLLNNWEKQLEMYPRRWVRKAFKKWRR